MELPERGASAIVKLVVMDLASANARPSSSEPPVVLRPGRPPLDLGTSGTMETCPDILRVADGGFIVIGTDVTGAYINGLLPDASCADYERIVKIPEATMLSAAEGLSAESGQGPGQCAGTSR